jgi:hypothetical protein
MLDKTRNVIALPTYNIEKRGKYWYFWKQPFFCFEAEPKGPYTTLRSVCLMIGVELFKEAASRFKR